jgi:hypothetical protein
MPASRIFGNCSPGGAKPQVNNPLPRRLLTLPSIYSVTSKISVVLRYRFFESGGGRCALVRRVRPPDDMCYQELQRSWGRIRRILPPFLKTVHFGSTPAGQALARALEPLVIHGRLSELRSPSRDRHPRMARVCIR